MTSEILQSLEDLAGSVVTRVEATRSEARIVTSGPGGSIVLTLTRCEWNDNRCETCRCSEDRVTIGVDR